MDKHLTSRRPYPAPPAARRRLVSHANESYPNKATLSGVAGGINHRPQNDRDPRTVTRAQHVLFSPGQYGRFKYPSLSDQAPTIRLLRILGIRRNLPPVNDMGVHINRRIECELTLAYLGDGGQRRPERYDAISYYWGAPSSPDRERTRFIILDGRSFPVSPIIFHVLQHLQTYEDRLIWLDFICIDQGNDTEKVFQIARMRDIYAQAEQVIVCLTDVMQLREARQMQPDGYLPPAHSMYGSPTLGTADFPSYLVAHPWFDRIWVVQEVCHARKVAINFRGKQIDGRQFAEAISLMRGSLFLPQGLSTNWYSNIRPLLQAMSKGTGSTRAPLIELLHKYRARDASLGVDKVFALLSLCVDDTRAPELAVDYTLQSREVFRNIARYIIRRTETLDIMTYRSRRQAADLLSPISRSKANSRDHIMPSSWIPIWDDRGSTVASTRSVSDISRYVDHAEPRGAPLQRARNVRKNDFELPVMGCRIGIITSVFVDGTVEAIPNSNLSKQIRTVWDWRGISKRLGDIARHLGSPSAPGLLTGDEMWILNGTTGLAVLRKCPSSPVTQGHLIPASQTRLLVTLEHSDFPRFGAYRLDHMPRSISETRVAALNEVATKPHAPTLTKIAALVARGPLTSIVLQ